MRVEPTPVFAQPGDHIRIGERLWEIVGVHLGAVGQESVFSVKSLAMIAPYSDREMFVPEPFFHAMLQSGIAILLRPNNALIPPPLPSAPEQGDPQ